MASVLGEKHWVHPAIEKPMFHMVISDVRIFALALRWL
jgi:hypothetical protein